MTPDQLIQFNQMKDELNQLKEVVYKNNYPDEMAFDKKLSCNDTLNVRKTIKFYNGSELCSGSQINDSGIKTEMGYTAPNGSIYMSTSPTQPFFIMVGTTWTLMNVP